MNRKLYLGIMGLFGVIFVISIAFLPYYNPVYFYVQHISLFLFMAMFIFALLNLGYRRLSKRIKNVSILKGFTLVVFALLMFGFSTIQLTAIDLYQTPDFQSCFYYDEYGNAIFYSQLVDSCPDLEDVVKTEGSLSFKVVEENRGIDTYDYIEGVYLEDVEYHSTVTTNVDIVYGMKGFIKSVVIRKFSLIDFEQGNDVLNAVVYTVDNSIVYEGDDPVKFVSYQTTDYRPDILSSEASLGDDQSYHEYIKYVAEKTYADNNDTTKLDRFQVLVTKEEYSNFEFYGEPEEEYLLQQLDFMCDGDDCSVYREDFNLPMAEYVALVQMGLNDNDLDYTYTISNEQIDIVYPLYYYQDDEKVFSTITYSNFKDYNGLVFDEITKSSTNRYEGTIKRSSFKYNGQDYVEHGDVYSVIYEMDYGYKVVNKLSTMEYEQEFEPPIIYSSSIMFYSTHTYRIENIYDYGVRTVYDLTDRDEIFYQKNPFIYSLIN